MFSVCFLIFLALYSGLSFNKKSFLIEDHCITDMTFEWTTTMNIWFREHIEVKNMYMIYAHCLMDLLMMTFLINFYFWWSTARPFFTIALFYPPRSFLQNTFLMGRPIGFMWFFPGMHSLTIPYFDTSDFYFSGHVGSSTTFMLEYQRSGWTKMSWFAFFVMINEWMLLCVLRTHYIIDLVTGLIIAYYLHRWGEKLAFFFDVKLLGVPMNKRQNYYYNPCYRCGWNNLNPSNFMDEHEASLQKATFNKNYANQLENYIDDSVSK